MPTPESDAAEPSAGLPVDRGAPLRPGRHRFRASLAGAALVLLTLLVYLPSLGNGYIWDDDDYVIKNANLRSAEGLWRIWFVPGATRQYYPLVHSTFWLEYQAWQLRPLGYHLDNVLLHALAAVATWRVLRRLGLGKGASWAAAAAFAVHPVHVESVAWITERKNVLMGSLGMFALLAYLRFEPALGAELDVDSGQGEARPRRWGFHGLALALFGLALLSKSIVATLPVLIAVLIWWKRGRLDFRTLLPLAPMVLLALPMGLMTIHMERHSVGARGEAFHLSLVERLLVAGRATWFYAWKLLAPLELAFIYPRWTIDPAAAWQWLFPLAAAATLATLWALRARWGRGAFAACAVFALALSPALGFVSVYPMLYSFVADHFQYVASIALIAAATAGVAQWIGAVAGAHAARVGAAAAVLWLGALAARTMMQTPHYRDAMALWRATLRVNPDSFMVHNNIGHLLMQREDKLEEAMWHFRAAVRANPQFPPAQMNMGVAAMRMNDPIAAEAAFNEAIRLWPEYAAAYANLGSLRLRQLRPRDAAPLLEKALAMGEVEAHGPLGASYALLGQLPQAEGHLRKAVDRSSPNPRYMLALGHVLLEQGGKDREAATCLGKAIQRLPDAAEGYFDLGVALDRLGEGELASGAFAEARRLRPDLILPKAGGAGGPKGATQPESFLGEDLRRDLRKE
ncbi:MAG: tetratricopeptide repeat protein [Planctomycetota bacterium]|nr:tetratricopeptide repeat protein [Planctomycetota bacterium]